MTLDWLGTLAAVAALGVMLGAAWRAWAYRDEFPLTTKRDEALRRMGGWDERLLLPPTQGNFKIVEKEEGDE